MCYRRYIHAQSVNVARCKTKAPELARALEDLATGDVLPLSADALVADTPFSGIRFETHF